VLLLLAEEIGMKRGRAIVRAAEDYFVFALATKTTVIPGWSEGPDPESRGCWREIPGSRFARPGMTVRGSYTPKTSFCILPP
jgi:hypothetical protein